LKLYCYNKIFIQIVVYGWISDSNAPLVELFLFSIVPFLVARKRAYSSEVIAKYLFALYSLVFTQPENEEILFAKKTLICSLMRKSSTFSFQIVYSERRNMKFKSIIIPGVKETFY
jgi:hypothetical protein